MFEANSIDRKMKTTPIFFYIRNAAFGPLAILWSIHKEEPRICRVLLSEPRISAQRKLISLFPHAILSSCLTIDTLMNQVIAFLNGEDIRFSLDIARLDLCSDFQQKVLHAEYTIPRGRVSTYQLIAKHLGHPKATRAVGTALAMNPFPILIPCHRVIRSNQTLGGYQGGLKMKRALLEMEGIPFKNGDGVATTNFFYRNKNV